MSKDFNKGTHHVMGFQLTTREAGLYEVSLSFITDKVEGNYDHLEILVEDDPHTIVCCCAKEHGHYCCIDPAAQSTPIVPHAERSAATEDDAAHRWAGIDETLTVFPVTAMRHHFSF